MSRSDTEDMLEEVLSREPTGSRVDEVLGGLDRVGLNAVRRRSFGGIQPLPAGALASSGSPGPRHGAHLLGLARALPHFPSGVVTQSARAGGGNPAGLANLNAGLNLLMARVKQGMSAGTCTRALGQSLLGDLMALLMQVQQMGG